MSYKRLSTHSGILPAAIAKDRADPAAEIEAFAAKQEPAIAKAVRAAFEAQRDLVPLDDLVAALEVGDLGRVLALLGVPEFDEAMDAVKTALQDSAFYAGALGAVQVARITGVTFTFNQLNPRLIDWLRTYELGLIRQINEGTREGVRQYLIGGMTEGRNPRDTARQVRQIVGLTNRQAQAVKNFRKELETFHLKRTGGGWNLGGKISRAPGGSQTFEPDDEGQPQDGIQERRLRDFRYDGQLQRAIANSKPLTPEQIDKMVDAYSRKYLKHRSENIARTEALRTTNFGVQDAWRQAIEAGKAREDLVRRQWVVSRDERLCGICAPIPKQNPKRGVRFGEPFDTPKGPLFLPPAHVSCRCTVWIRAFEPAQLQD